MNFITQHTQRLELKSEGKKDFNVYTNFMSAQLESTFKSTKRCPRLRLRLTFKESIFSELGPSLKTIRFNKMEA